MQRGSETIGFPLESSRIIHSIPFRTGGQNAQHSALHFSGLHLSSRSTATLIISSHSYLFNMSSIIWADLS